MSGDIPAALSALFDEPGRDPDRLLGRVVETYGRAVGAPRCLLFLYEPERGLSRCTHAWQARPEWALARRVDAWEPLAADLPAKDPLFATALVDPVAVCIDDVASADPALVNASYERQHFGHLSLIHAPLLDDGKLHGILEPCTIATPRAWTARDRTITAWTQTMLLPVAKRYVAADCPR